MTDSKTASVYASAEQLLLDGKLEKARNVLQDALTLDENAGQLWELLGAVHYTENRVQEATRALEQAVLMVPLSNCSQFLLAMCYEKQGKEVGTILQHLASREDLDDTLLEPLARALGRAGDCEGAIRICSEAARRHPNAPEPLMGIVFYLRRLKRPADELLPILFRAHHLDPGDVDCRITLAWVLHECEQSTEAAYLLSFLPIEEFRCPNCLSSMQVIFRAAGNCECEARCIQTQYALMEGNG